MRALKSIAIGIAVIVFLAMTAWYTSRWMTSRERTAWKSTALARLATVSTNTDEIRADFAEIKADLAGPQPPWTGDHVAIMKNGDFIIFEYRHGRNDYFPPHLFLGRTSRGQWLYSSYHFCNGMAMVRMAPQPASIEEFARTYHARKFDGKSDECLKLTY